MNWKECYPGYLVSDTGLCKREQKVIITKDGKLRKLPERLMKGSLDPQGYVMFTFNQKAYLAHRVVAKLFIPNPDNLPTVNHKNGIKADNRIDNLEWATYSSNHKHAYDVLGRVAYWTDKKGKNNRRSKPVWKLDSLDQKIAEYSSAREASTAHNCKQNAVSKAIREGYKIRGNKFVYAA